MHRYSKRLPHYPKSYSLILDGQQRLTSFYIGIYGSYTTRIHGAWKKNASSYNRRHLYLDLLSGKKTEEGHDRGLVYEFDFRKSGGLNKAGDSYWLKVASLLATEDTLTADAFLEKEQFLDEVQTRLSSSLSDTERSDALSTAKKLWWGVNERDAVLTETTTTDDKTARELFIRRNKGGIELSGVDILLALLTGYWDTDEEGTPTDAKNEIEQFTDRLSGNERLSEEGFTFGKRFTLRTLLLLSKETPSFRKDGRYDGERLEEAEDIFHDPEFEQAVVDAFELAADLGFHNAALSSKTVVTPVVQFLYEHDYDTTGGNEEIHYWLATAVLNSIFGDIGSQQVLETARDHVLESGGEEFPAREIFEDLSGRGTTTHLDEDILDQLLDEINYQSGSRRNVLLTHLYRGARRAGHAAYEVDHIFPRRKLAKSTYLEQHGVPTERVDWYKEHRDHIANLQLLSSDGENQSKSDRDFSDWLERIEEGKVENIPSKEDYFETHRIPQNPPQYEYPQFEGFLMGESGRKQLIKEELLQTLPLRTPD